MPYLLSISYSTPEKEIQTKEFQMIFLESAEKSLKEWKDRLISMGCRILRLRVYEINQIQIPEQI